MIAALLALLAAGAAAAQDCDAIRRIPERLICANEGVRTADAAMTEAYRALRERSEAFAVTLEFENPIAVGEIVSDLARRLAVPVRA